MGEDLRNQTLGKLSFHAGERPDSWSGRAMIIASQRSGSTFLAQALDSHPMIWCPDIEPFWTDNWRTFLIRLVAGGRQLHRFYAEQQLPIRAREHPPEWNARYVPLKGPCEATSVVIMAKVMLNQLLFSPSLHRYLARNKDIRLLFLRRENLLKQHVSNMLNKQRRHDGRSPHSTTPVYPVTIRISPERAISRMRLTHLQYVWYRRQLGAHPIIELTYESMIGQGSLTPETTQRVCDFLGLPLKPLQSELVKMNPDNLAEIVENYEELKNALAGTEFEKYLR